MNIVKTCYHCGAECKQFAVKYDEFNFCCNGCQSVYEILQKNQLCNYYSLASYPGIKSNDSVAEKTFAYLDEPSFQEKLIRYKQGNILQACFSIPQMHCISCLWLLERLSSIHPGIHSSRVSFATKEVFIMFDRVKMKLSEVASLLSHIGYKPSLHSQNDDAKKTDTGKKNRIWKLGLSGFCFANIMMLSFPEYLSRKGTLDPALAVYFQWITILLSIPVLFYCAAEFFKTAYSGLQKRILHIDLPVALALAITFLRSLYEIFWLNQPGYLDSISGIVFFMLIGRWVQDNTSRTIHFNRDYKSFFPIAVKKIESGLENFIPIQEIKKNDLIEVKNQEIIPADSMLVSENALIDYSFVTGESTPVHIQKGETIYAGGKQLQTSILLNVINPVSQSYLTSLWENSIFTKEKNNDDKAIDKVAIYFTYTVLALSAIAGMYWYIKGENLLMWNAITTVLLVACPCALLLAEHFTNGNILGILGMNGFYIKNKKVLHQLLQINKVVLDKTGTLTTANAMYPKYHGETLTDSQINDVASLLYQSGHPLHLAFSSYYYVTAKSTIQNFKMTTGAGAEAWMNETYHKIGSAAFCKVANASTKGSEVHVIIDSKYYGFFEVQQNYRDGIKELLHDLKLKYEVALISGDNNSEEENIKKLLGNHAEIYFGASPSKKMEIIESMRMKGEKVLFVGDGLNDAGALQQSDIGIAVSENNSLFAPQCDAIIAAGQLTHLEKFIRFIEKGRSIVWITFIISAIYNVAGLYFALQGILSPVIAAILMPLSSITIISFTYFAVRYYAQKANLKTTS